MASLVFTSPSPSISEVLEEKSKGISSALKATVKESAKHIESAGRKHLSSAGFKSPRWATSLNVEAVGDDKILARETMWQWAVFEKGATIRSKRRGPVWVPLSSGGAKVRARDYPGGLFKVDRKGGAPSLLLSRETKKPLYVAVEQVTLRKRLSLVDTITKAAEEIPEIFQEKVDAT